MQLDLRGDKRIPTMSMDATFRSRRVMLSIYAFAVYLLESSNVVPSLMYLRSGLGEADWWFGLI